MKIYAGYSKLHKYCICVYIGWSNIVDMLRKWLWKFPGAIQCSEEEKSICNGSVDLLILFALQKEKKIAGQKEWDERR